MFNGNLYVARVNNRIIKQWITPVMVGLLEHRLQSVSTRVDVTDIPDPLSPRMTSIRAPNSTVPI